MIKMTKKRMLALGLSALMCAGESVFAQIELDGGVSVRSERNVSVTVKADPGAGVAIKVFAESDNIVRAIDEVRANSDGKAVFGFRMPAVAASGKYVIDVCIGDGVAESFYFDYADFSGFLAAVNAEGVTAQQIIDFLKPEVGNQYTATVMGFDMTSYNNLTDAEKNEVIELFLTNKGTGTSEEEIADAFAKALGNKLAQKGDITKGLEYYNPTFDGKKYSELNEEEKKWIISSVSESMTATGDINAAYESAVILYSFNTAKNSQMGDLITTYATKTGIGASAYYTTYTTLLDARKSAVHDSMIAALGSIKTYPGLVTVFNNAVTANAYGVPAGGGGGGGSISKAPISVPIPVIPEKFSDLSGYDWAKEAILNLAEKEIVSGYEDGTFLPAKTVLREEFVKMAVCAAGKFNESAKCDFADVEEDKWYYPYIASAVEAGIISGTDENNFGISMAVSRQDMAVIVQRTLALMGKELESVREYTGFTDEDAISDYAKESVKLLYTAGLINGMEDGSFAPAQPATRAQSAKILADAFIAKEGE